MLLQLRWLDGTVDDFLQRHADRGGWLDAATWPRPLEHLVGRVVGEARGTAVKSAGWGSQPVPLAELRSNVTPWLADEEMDVSQKYLEGV